MTKIQIQFPILRFFLGDSKFNLCLLDSNNPTDNSCKVHPGSNPGSPSLACLPGYGTGVYSTNTLLPCSMSECSIGRQRSMLPTSLISAFQRSANGFVKSDPFAENFRTLPFIGHQYPLSLKPGIFSTMPLIAATSSPSTSREMVCDSAPSYKKISDTIPKTLNSRTSRSSLSSETGKG